MADKEFETCAYCRFFDEESWECHRHAPTSRDKANDSYWPRVAIGNWCGEWQSKDVGRG